MRMKTRKAKHGKLSGKSEVICSISSKTLSLMFLMASVYAAGKPIPEFQSDSEATLWK